ncbi:MAG: synthase delta subunit [Verrucomicrobiota bacterium]|jgi:F-type H+-transporting ATPase subunit delta
MDANDAKLARQLARLILDAGEAGLPEIKSALERITEHRSDQSRRNWLKTFRKELSRQLRQRTLLVESAEPLSDTVCEGLRQRFQEGREERLYLTRQVNEALIAGIKVRLGDTVYDASAARLLQSLSQSL